MSTNNDFKIIYKILSKLEKALDYEEFESNMIYETLKEEISKERYNKILLMLYEENYIKGNLITSLDYKDLKDFEITLKGLEYLKENSIMKKIGNTLKGTAEVIGNIKP